MRTPFFALFALALAGCNTPSTPVAQRYSPVQAVMLAAERLEGVTGVFEMTVRGSGQQGGRYFLNSEPDYRDQRCLTVALTAAAHRELSVRLGGDPVTLLNGKKIVITGTAKRVRIDFTSMGIATGKYYYQTHLTLNDASQIKVVD